MNIIHSINSYQQYQDENFFFTAKHTSQTIINGSINALIKAKDRVKILLHSPLYKFINLVDL